MSRKVAKSIVKAFLVSVVVISVVMLVWRFKQWMAEQAMASLVNPIVADGSMPQMASGSLHYINKRDGTVLELDIQPTKALAVRLTNSLVHAQPRVMSTREQVIGWFTLKLNSGAVFEIQLHDHGALYIDGNTFFMNEAEANEMIVDIIALAQRDGS